MGPHQGRVEGEENLPRPAGHTLLHAPQDPISLLGNQGTLLAHGHLVIPQDTQVPLHRAALQQVSPEPVLVHGVVPSQVQDLALALVEFHQVPLRPTLQPVQVLLNGSTALWCTSHSSQFCVISKLDGDTVPQADLKGPLYALQRTSRIHLNYPNLVIAYMRQDL